MTSSPDHRGVRVGVPKESRDGERRVSLVPTIVGKLTKRGLQVVVESGAGVGALMPDELFVEAGATIGDPWDADVVLKVAPPTTEEIERLRSGATLIGFLAPLSDPKITDALRSAGVTGFAMESIPRISRAQSMD
ncbi:MAG: NAD(P)(+) transhydrogenase (Re/Si-specific) subunit alpha, partial [Actinomycetota bacterium]|nr:NAD(P)(+) transhydrogenase (Re/Si-specific) subunit alpha [Actinomycetota bacterium]